MVLYPKVSAILFDKNDSPIGSAKPWFVSGLKLTPNSSGTFDLTIGQNQLSGKNLYHIGYHLLILASNHTYQKNQFKVTYNLFTPQSYYNINLTNIHTINYLLIPMIKTWTKIQWVTSIPCKFVLSIFKNYIR
jgi:hypothetical protein